MGVDREKRQPRGQPVEPVTKLGSPGGQTGVMGGNSKGGMGLGEFS